MEALAPRFDYESHSPYTILVVNEPGEPMVKSKRSLRKAVSWMFDAIDGSNGVCNVIFDAAGCLIYLGSRNASHIIATNECFMEMERRAELHADHDSLMPLLLELEMSSRVLWPDQKGRP